MTVTIMTEGLTKHYIFDNTEEVHITTDGRGLEIQQEEPEYGWGWVVKETEKCDR